MPSRATRQINYRSRVSGRGSLVRLRRFDNRLLHLVAESFAEIRCVNLLMARPDVIDIWDQPEPVRFTKANGKTGTHTFDYLVKLTSGRKIAIAVKPATRSRKPDFQHDLARIAQELPTAFADSVLLHTEQDVQSYHATNAARMCEFVKQPDPEADEAILKEASRTNGRVLLSDLVKMTGLGGRAYRAAHRCIFDGYLVACRSGLITPLIMVKGHSQ